MDEVISGVGGDDMLGDWIGVRQLRFEDREGKRKPDFAWAVRRQDAFRIDGLLKCLMTKIGINESLQLNMK